jgi:hypothetical protein
VQASDEPEMGSLERKDAFCAENKRFAWKTNFTGKVNNPCRSFAALANKHCVEEMA